MPQKRKLGGTRKSLKRQVKTRDLRERFLIVCEGKKTEPLYFEGKIKIKTVNKILRMR